MMATTVRCTQCHQNYSRGCSTDLAELNLCPRCRGVPPLMPPNQTIKEDGTIVDVPPAPSRDQTAIEAIGGLTDFTPQEIMEFILALGREELRLDSDWGQEVWRTATQPNERDTRLSCEPTMPQAVVRAMHQIRETK